MKKILIFLIGMGWVLLADAQNYSDTIASLHVSLNNKQKKILQEANESVKESLPYKQKYEFEQNEIDVLKKEANTQLTASKKKKVLKKVLKKEKKLLKYQEKYLDKTDLENAKYHQLFVDLYKNMPIPPNGFSQQIVDSLIASSAKKIRISKSKRKKASRVKDRYEMVQTLESAYLNEMLAISDLVTALKIGNQLVTVQVPTPRVHQEAKVGHTVVSDVPNKKPPVFEEIRVIYKIQIAASRIELPLTKLRLIYTTKPEEQINSEIEDGWYKYSIGRYHSYSEASGHKEELAVKGAFIIAYRDEKKIQIKSESSGDLERISGVEVVFRIQISATKNPATPKKVKQMNMSNRIVNITQKNGWYKYTVGNYTSRREAESALRTMTARGAFVVAYSTSGEEVQLEGF